MLVSECRMSVVSDGDEWQLHGGANLFMPLTALRQAI